VDAATLRNRLNRVLTHESVAPEQVISELAADVEGGLVGDAFSLGSLEDRSRRLLRLIGSLRHGTRTRFFMLPVLRQRSLRKWWVLG